MCFLERAWQDVWHCRLDIICCYKGLFIGFEMKNDIGKAAKLQEAASCKIRKCGGIAVVVRSVDVVRAVIESL